MFKYSIQCDNLRTKKENGIRVNCEKGEDIWQRMMKNKVVISKEEFVSVCDIESLLDGESLEEFTLSDKESSFNKSYIDGISLYFIQTCGFEFIFTENGIDPRLL